MAQRLRPQGCYITDMLWDRKMWPIHRKTMRQWKMPQKEPNIQTRQQWHQSDHCTGFCEPKRLCWRTREVWWQAFWQVGNINKRYTLLHKMHMSSGDEYYNNQTHCIFGLEGESANLKTNQRRLCKLKTEKWRKIDIAKETCNVVGHATHV